MMVVFIQVCLKELLEIFYIKLPCCVSTSSSLSNKFPLTSSNPSASKSLVHFWELTDFCAGVAGFTGDSCNLNDVNYYHYGRLIYW